MEAGFTHFFEVVLDGFYEIICSECDMRLSADPTVNLIYSGPARGPVIRCIICGVTPDTANNTEEDEPESDGQ